jgi:hypothetical protein
MAHINPGRLLRHAWTQGETRRPIVGPTRPTTLAEAGRDCAATRAGTPQAVSPVAADKVQLSAGMSATLSAQLKGRVASDLVADIVRAVLDERRQAARLWDVEPMMIEARQRLERFIRASASR